MMKTTNNSLISKQVIEDACEWAIMHGVAFRQSDNTARHCPFSIAPMGIGRDVYQHLLKVTPLLTKLISNVSEDHDFLQATLGDMANADPFFGRLMELHQTAHGDINSRRQPARQPLLIMRTDYMDDRVHGPKVIEFNGIAAGMAPFGQRAYEFHNFMRNQWPEVYLDWVEDRDAISAENHGLGQLALGITMAAKKVRAEFKTEGNPTFLMVVQNDEDNVYDQHLLEVELQKLGVRTLRRTFNQLSTQLATGTNNRLLLEGVGAIDVVYLRAGYQYSDYFSRELNESICCHTLSQTRLFIEQHNVALNATISQQLATSKTMQMVLTNLPEKAYTRWGLNREEARLVRSVLADMKPINDDTIEWFHTRANKQEWVLKNQGEGGGHCIFGHSISDKLKSLPASEYDAWALMLRLHPHEREKPTIAVRDGNQTEVKDLVSEIGLFTVYFNAEPATEFNGYAGYLIRSKPASENEGGIHSGKGILDSLVLL